MDLDPEDVDILMPRMFFQEKWERLLELMAKEGYTLFDLREHSFLRNGSIVAFAAYDLDELINISLEEVPIVSDSGINYKLLTLTQYLAVYERFMKDGYRKNTKGRQDAEKIALIKQACMRERN
jgi:hypothetical protein